MKRNPQATREARSAILAEVDRRVASTERFIRVTNGYGNLDDEPEHPIVEVARIFEEAEAKREGRRPHLEAPRSFAAELQALALMRGWRFERDHNGDFLVWRDPVMCPGCQGVGRVRVREPLRFAANIAERVAIETCSRCGGKGRI